MQNRFEYIDIHCHTNFSAFDADREEVIKRAQDAGVFMINVGTQKDTSKSAVDLANKFESGVYASIGIHPIHSDKSFHDKDELGEGGHEFTSRGEEFDYEYYKKLALDPKTVAIGECGMDYYRMEGDSKKKQLEIFEKQIDLANEVGKPLMIHVRDAYEDVIEILKRKAKVKFNVHFFAGSLDIARQFLELGGTLSFTGVITFAKQYEELVKFVPLDRIFCETDSPYVSPVPFRGKRNEPTYVIEVYKKMAEIKGISVEELKMAIKKNAEVVFGIK